MFQALIGPIADLAGSFMQGQINKQNVEGTKKNSVFIGQKIQNSIFHNKEL